MTVFVPAIDAPIERVEVFRLRIPLDAPLSVLGKLTTTREYIVARVYASGYVGIGIGLTRDADLEYVVQRSIFPHVIHQPVGAIRATWENARAAMRMIGEAGLFARALAVVDIAQWDLLGQLLHTPLWRLLGGRSSSVPCLAIMGYYRADDPIGTLRREAAQLLEAGFTRFKIPFGGDAHLDSTRVAELRAVVGREALIALDASASFNTLKEAMAAISSVAPFNIDFVEDPFPAHQHRLAMRLAQETPMKIAFGESVSLPGIIQMLGSEGGVDIVRPDATHQMGITGYLQGVLPALEHGRTLFPHYFPDIHAPLVGALGGMMVEESPLVADTTAFHRLRTKQPHIEEGMWQLSEAAGLGIPWDEDALMQYRAGVAS